MISIVHRTTIFIFLSTDIMSFCSFNKTLWEVKLCVLVHPFQKFADTWEILCIIEYFSGK